MAKTPLFFIRHFPIDIGPGFFSGPMSLAWSDEQVVHTRSSGRASFCPEE